MNAEAYQVTWLIRRLFRAMAEHADRYLRDSGLSAADRAVLEFLYPEEQLTVPDIARRYQVTRQHVQATANRLLDRRLVCAVENPRHKRSSLLQLSDRGRHLFARIRRREQQLLDDLFADIEIADIATTRRTLQRLFDQLQEETS
mgnify:FL=1